MPLESFGCSGSSTKAAAPVPIDQRTTTHGFPQDDTWVPYECNPREIPAEFGHYHILDKIGQGGMGIVYLAEDSRDGSKIALKVPFVAKEDDAKRLQRFANEGRAAAAIQHPHVCPVLEADEIEGQLYMTMPFLFGQTLADWMESQPELPVEDALQLVAKLALGIQAAHEAGIVHRDLKPANVMIDETNEPRIIDFSAARFMDQDAPCQKTDKGMVGTIGYMSPEQVSGDSQVGPAADIYSLGLVMYELLTKQRPFNGSLSTMMGAIVCDPPMAPTSLRPDLDEKLCQLCLKALEKRPADRYTSAVEFADAINEYLDR